MKTLLIIQDVNISTGEVFTNKGIFTNNQWDMLMFHIKAILKDHSNHRYGFKNVREFKRGYILDYFNLDWYRTNIA